MKIPYIKLYTADLLAASRNLTPQQIGEAVLGICEQAFENDTLYQPQNGREKTLFDMLNHWKEESLQNYKQNRKVAKKASHMRWQKTQVSDGASSIGNPNATAKCQTETKTETETETKTDTETETEKNISLTAQDEPAQGERVSSLSSPKTTLHRFAAEVLEHFEPPLNAVQQEIWFKRNARCLRDILQFCKENIPLALQTVSVCATRLARGGVTGGYEAVCRNLPEYMLKAQQELQGASDAGR